MGVLSTVLTIVGFGWGVGIGLVVGYFFFIYSQSAEVKNPLVRPVEELDMKSLRALLPEMPLWIKNPDYERVDWLNKFVSHMWPYLSKAICKEISANVKPYFDQYGSKLKLNLGFETLTLGSLPPTLVGVKVYDTQEKEMIIEPSLKWAGNPNIIVAAKGFGLKVTVQVVDLQVFATARVTLKPLVPLFPCFSKIVVSLMEKPHVDFGLKLIGGDLMAIPGLYAFIQETIKEQIATLYLWPKTMEISIIDAPVVKQPVGMLHVKVVSAANLNRKDILGKSDPYVKLILGEGALAKKKTTTKLNTLNPEWNESFNLTVQDPDTQVLELHAYDWEKVGSHDKLGMQTVPLNSLIPNEPKPLTLKLLKNLDPNDVANLKPRGTLTLEVTYKPFKEEELSALDETNSMERAVDEIPHGGGLLVVTIHEAEDLEGKHHTNPFVRLTFRGEEKKTKPVKKNRDPRWGEFFEFVLDEPPVNDRLHLEVISKGSGLVFHFRESLGYVDINLVDVVNNKRTNEKYQLIDSKNGKLLVELQWKPS